MGWVVLVWAAAIGAAPKSSTVAAAREVWAGHAVVVGHRSVPFLGKVEAKTSSFVLARVTRHGPNKISLLQASCAIELANPTGVTLSLVEGAAEKLPAVSLELERRPDGMFYQAPATSGWKTEDVDRDGKPGMTLVVDAPICGGKIFAGVETTSQSRGELGARGGFEGELRARVRQEVLGTEGACLGVLVKSSDERVTGRFAYVPVDPATSCASFTKESWPVKVVETSKSTAR